MNVSMADSFNLAWKLTHVVSGVAANPKDLLSTYATERRLIADQLIELDRRWYSVQWADEERKKQPGYQEECVKLYQDISGFTSGCGIQYGESSIVVKPECTIGSKASPVILGVGGDVKASSLHNGKVKPGRRLQNASLMRIADGCQCDIHDNLIPDGASWKIIVFCGRDCLDRCSRSSEVLQAIFSQLLPRFSRELLDVSVVTPDMVYSPDGSSSGTQPVSGYELWNLLPIGVKQGAEMNTFSLTDEGYGTYGIDLDIGAIVIVRPDGIVGNVLALDVQTVDSRLVTFLDGLYVARETSSG